MKRSDLRGLLFKVPVRLRSQKQLCPCFSAAQRKAACSSNPIRPRFAKGRLPCWVPSLLDTGLQACRALGASTKEAGT
jgi:hypothetical protein